jgi:hypothetical protein
MVRCRCSTRGCRTVAVSASPRARVRRGADPTTLERRRSARGRVAAGTRSGRSPKTEGPAIPCEQRILACQEPKGDRDLASTPHAELLPQDVAVSLGGSGGDPEPRSDLIVRAAGCDERDDLALAIRDRRSPSFRDQLHHGRDRTPSIEGRLFLTRCIRRCIVEPAAAQVIGTWRSTFGATRSRISVRLSPVQVMPWFRRPMTACAGSGSSATRSATASASCCVPQG